MKISAITPQIYKSPSFKSICPSYTKEADIAYSKYSSRYSQFSKFVDHTTGLTRDIYTPPAMMRLINPERKTEIRVLGSSDGSQCWAFAIAAKELLGANSKKIAIEGIDIAKPVVALAKTGYIVLADEEKIIMDEIYPQFGAESSVFNKYFMGASAPAEFRSIKSKYPYMGYLDNNPAAKEASSRLRWYKVNKKDLPKVSFYQGNMLNCTQADKSAQDVIYSISNSLVYALRGGDISSGVNLFEKIKQNSKDKNQVYVILGGLERKYMAGEFDKYMSAPVGGKFKKKVEDMGFVPVDEKELDRAQIEGAKFMTSKIYRLQ